MTWGSVTGINWPGWLASDRALDPYLIWADITGFASSGGVPDGSLPFLLEGATDLRLSEQGFPSPLKNVRLPAAYLTSAARRRRGGQFMTALVDVQDIASLVAADSLISRFQLSAARPGHQPLSRMDDQARPALPLPRSARPEAPAPLSCLTVVGVIDDGCPFAHSNLLDEEGRTRVRYLWDQAAVASSALNSVAWREPKGFAHGLQISGEALDMYRAAFPSSAVYAALGFDRITGRQRTHGSGVCHLATGGREPVDIAGRAANATQEPLLPVVFVQLPLRTVADTTGGSIGFHVLNALHYIDARVRDLAAASIDSGSVRSVVNLSYGSVAGPHDGTSLAERAIADFLTQHANMSLVVPAGNANLDRMHLEVDLPSKGTRVIDWMVGPDNPLESFLEVWWPEGSELSHVDVRLARAGAGDGVVAGPGAMAVDDPHGPRCAVVFCNRVAQGQNGTMTLVAMRATRGGSAAQAGIWQVSITNRGTQPIRGVHVWVERNDLVLGPRRRQQSTLLIPPPARGARSAVTLASMSNIDAVGTFGVPYTTRYLVVGASRLSDGQRSEYSSNGPARGTERHGPDGLAPGDAGCARSGLLVDGAFDGQWTRMSGTSAAAAVVARQLAADCERTARAHRSPPAPKPGNPSQGGRSGLKVTFPQTGLDGWFRLEQGPPANGESH